MKKLLLAGVCLFTLAAGANTALADDCDPGEIVIKFSHDVAETHPKGVAAKMLAERVNKEMNGKACMEVFPNSTLFDDDKVKEAMLLGDVQLAAPSLSKFEAYTKKYRLFDLPFLFNDLAAVNNFYHSDAANQLLHAVDDVGFTGLHFWASGIKQFSAKKPLLVPSDAKGLKFRIQPSDVAQAMIEAMGASAQKLAFKEVYGALQTGVVDGQENSWCNIYTQKFYEVQDGVTETNHGLLGYLVVTSKDWLDGLEPDVRDQFMKILDEVTDEFNNSIAGKEQTCKEDLIKAGGTVRELTPEQRQEWVTTMKPVWDQFEGDVGKDMIEAAVASNK
ncbi:DctP family TRAP transporter solute-binding subunit [Rhizobium sp. NRK18]|uniref:DctP family TRAP transporter solute-binding subunit n=1 Tax=Rhizobium sp. NRK18 TaxID=2964667 RepID=UPI0021C32219|nr:DctP family TRAP transporter solute-binding subunit [Rhizobium sp. NRK18]MCQ2002951.1 DctP family TRAP transporter solute-binding subunit [Rhizobium sp. NRK18]